MKAILIALVFGIAACPAADSPKFSGGTKINTAVALEMDFGGNDMKTWVQKWLKDNSKPGDRQIEVLIRIEGQDIEMTYDELKARLVGPKPAVNNSGLTLWNGCNVNPVQWN